ncbi:UNVERIFIED_ORG: 2-polyprenyl-6-methoxyphenol hydroxylase-like FAD-dependent oxidoreductase [Paenarthrobacter nicotinovorans]|uniref:styrene monooxygenase/indole monooxygenase family protein n=1 Tax=Paenarthrobacter histidinolovorans TaxID=43664 RepID=UPI001665278B|nr:styrene monooxygenase/indole monooxygenase family protein [Paenarthrobacter histidinolovorans]GGJ34567.1 putative oxygenase [Paenarthrobacter histidinolovorans]
MSRFAIIGAGQTGATFALALLSKGHEVALYSDRSPQSLYEDVPATGTAVMYGEALAVEERLGLHTYRDKAPLIEGLTGWVSSSSGMEVMAMAGSLGDMPGVGVDTRLRSFDRVNEFIRLGGTFIVEDVSPESLDTIAAAHDLTFVATGKRGLTDLFAGNAARSKYTEPQRALAMITVTGLPTDSSAFAHRSDHGGAYNAFSIVGDMGETIWCPYLHKTAGPSWSFLGFGRIGTEWEERLSSPSNAQEMLETVKGLHKEFLPWDAAFIANAEVIPDDRFSWLKGRVKPTVRDAVGFTASGHAVMSLGDTSMTFDPIGAQGAQSGMKQVGHYLDALESHDGPFDAEWIRSTFEDFFHKSGQASTALTSILLDQDAGGSVNETIFLASNGDRRVADGFFQLLSRPQSALPFKDIAAVHAWIEQLCPGETADEILGRSLSRIKEAEQLHAQGLPYFPRA